MPTDGIAVLLPSEAFGQVFAFRAPAWHAKCQCLMLRLKKELRKQLFKKECGKQWWKYIGCILTRAHGRFASAEHTVRTGYILHVPTPPTR